MGEEGRSGAEGKSTYGKNGSGGDSNRKIDSEGSVSRTNCSSTGFLQGDGLGGGSGRSDCFVVTEVYGGERNHPNVERMREFRDNVLFMYPWGRKFIHFYYNGFGFGASMFMKRYLPLWIISILKTFFDKFVPLLSTDVLETTRQVPRIAQMDLKKFSLSCAEFLIKEAKKREFNCLCVGLSGGVDSAVVAALCELTNMDVIAVTVTGTGFIREEDVCDAKIVAKRLGIKHSVVNLTNIFESVMKSELPNIEHIIMGIRNVAVKEIAENHNALLIGSGVKTELYAGLFSPNSILGAIFPLADIFKTQIYDLAQYLDLPDCVKQKPSHSGIVAEQNDAFWGLDYALFDWVSLLIEEKMVTKEITTKTGVKKCVVNAMRYQKALSNNLLKFPDFKVSS